MITAGDIRAARAALNESQRAFGVRFGVDQGTISRWETTGPPRTGLVQIALSDGLDHLKRAHPEAFAQAPQVGEGGGEGGCGEGPATGHDATLGEPGAEVTANSDGRFA